MGEEYPAHKSKEPKMENIFKAKIRPRVDILKKFEDIPLYGLFLDSIDRLCVKVAQRYYCAAVGDCLCTFFSCDPQRLVRPYKMVAVEVELL